ncbi:MAG: TniQ family protein [Chloroflexota bacterium]|nr:TniQ family protein [Chloroflexota bacterium]
MTEPVESFVGYADRLAFHLEIPLSTLLRHIGVMKEGTQAVLPGGYGVFLSPQLLRRFADATRLPEETVAGMLLMRYDGMCVDFSGIDVSDTRSMRHPSNRFWAYLAGTHACPLCLAGCTDKETRGVWDLSWKLPWSFACVKHRVLLLDRCPACDTRLRTGTPSNRGKPASMSHVLDPALCANSKPRQQRVQGHDGPCGHPLTEVVTPSLARWPGVLEAQEYLQRLLDGSAVPIVAGEVVPTLEYFNTLRTLSSLLLAYCTAEDLREAPTFALNSFERRRGAYLGGRRAKPAYAFHKPPEDTVMLCAIVPAAVGLTRVGSVDALAHALDPIVRRTLAEGVQFSTVLRMLAASNKHLVAAFDIISTGRMNPATVLLRQNDNRISDSVRQRGFSPDYVPQLLWEDTYSELFADLFDHKSRYYARRVCSMSTVRLLGPPSWPKAAELLELPVPRSSEIAKELVGNLRRSDEENLETFAERIDEVARRMTETSEAERVNYRQRRRALEHLEVVPYAEWKRICQEVGIGPGKDGVRNRCAAAWIWCRLAGGDRWLSPAISVNDDNTIRVHYQRFEKECAGELERLLTEYGHALLREAGCR